MALDVTQPIYVADTLKGTPVGSQSKYRKNAPNSIEGAHTKPEHIRNLIEDYQRADKLSYRPNQMLGIVFSRFDDDKQTDPLELSKNLRRAIADCLRRHNALYIAVGIHENDRRGGHGLHIHILLYLPEDRFSELLTALTTCLAKRCNNFLKKLAKTKGVAFKSRTSAYELYQRLEPHYHKSLPFHFSDVTPMTKNDSEQRLAYLCKSIDPNYKITFRGNTVSISEMDWRATGEGTKLQAQSCNRPSRPIFSAGNIHRTCLTPANEGYDPILIDETFVPSIRIQNNIQRATNAYEKSLGLSHD
ncbi:hypothetical protein [Acetobacter orleanensis]|uniref:Uncharacterized protein n=1 Tax=Acetobacter orleanensis TaxID=104099 RepID=A0A4Y3TNR3_9PROT|nr:hypothetical protein [Acetobacter orleanensis]KXV62309.1 hypothetical protein AD949_11105 [Acetobacter orleanensis]PCD79474.1 hypothetical protein CO710_07505 [Acetobacter orleanensis]GAN69125.1 hypothetical protein Abol_026_027 [Acetobacter orleanensis JCM 7639]GBR25788.1 hypothetical protein AA0473_0980 [Acetobacter orleanensis NRIC 0473]GEB82610.1 hypothetical protein AOR01nite_10870 [Acetobacter orleanensis]